LDNKISDSIALHFAELKATPIASSGSLTIIMSLKAIMGETTLRCYPYQSYNRVSGFKILEIH